MKYSPKDMALTDPRSSSPSSDPLRWAGLMKEALLAKLGGAHPSNR